MTRRAKETKKYKKGYYLVKILDANDKNSYGVPKLIGEYDLNIEENHSYDEIVRKIAAKMQVEKSSIIVNVIEPNKRVKKDIKNSFEYDIKSVNTPEEHHLILHADNAFIQRVTIIYDAITQKMSIKPEGSIKISVLAKAIKFYGMSEEEQKAAHQHLLEETKKQKNAYLLIITSMFEMLMQYRGKLIGEQNEQR